MWLVIIYFLTCRLTAFYMDKGLLMNCREKSHWFLLWKILWLDTVKCSAQMFFLFMHKPYLEWSIFFFLRGGGGGGFHCLSLYQNDFYRNKLVSKWLVSQSLSIKLSLGIVAAPDVYPKKIYKKQANWLNDTTMVLNSICKLSWLFSVSHHSKLVWSYRSVICLCVRL